MYTIAIQEKKINVKNDPESGNVYCAIITYADRGHFVYRQCVYLYSIGIKKIIVVDNHSQETSRIILDDLKAKYAEKLTLIRMEKNTGTAHAFKMAMQTAELDVGCDFLWILDDDNMPDADALPELRKLWKKTTIEDKESMLMLASYRKTKGVYKRAVCTRKPDIIIGERNYFRAFHLARVFDMICHKSGNKDYPVMPESGEISAAPYGGMFFHKKILMRIGYPDERFHIYCDDHEFSHRVVLRGGKIILSLKSTITDVEESWNARGLGVFNITKHHNNSLLYYSIRNRVLLELKITVNNYITYFANAIIYTFTVFFISLFRLKFSNFMAYFNGVSDGFRGRSGIREKYPLE